ncbi:MAG: ABC transporter substrate-binding protein [Oscillospiraceae bacterium]
MKKELTAIILAGVLTMSLAACGTKPAETSATPTAQTGMMGEQSYKVGILQQLEHPALDAATEGFKKALTEKLGDKVEFEYANAQNDSPTCTTIANKFVTDGVDLIMANATTALQAAASATAEIPIVGTSVTDYIAAGVLMGDNDAPGGNVTGASDLAPLDQQADLLLELCPDAKIVGILYSSGEPNSVFQSDKMTALLEDKGIEVKVFTVADSNEVQSVVSGAVEQIDALYIPTDNTMADNIGLVKNITAPAGIPVICGEENMCAGGGLATLSISYSDMGYNAGLIAVSILLGEADPATTPIAYCSEVTKKFNPEVAELLGITIPEGIEAIG